MKAGRARTAAGASALVALAALLAGCTTLTDDNPTPTATSTESARPGIPVTPNATPELPSLEPEDGEALSAKLSGDGGSAEIKAKLKVATTYVSWMCVGNGPIVVSLGDENSYTGQCDGSGEVMHLRNEFMNNTVREAAFKVEAQPGQQWVATVTQIAKK